MTTGTFLVVVFNFKKNNFLPIIQCVRGFQPIPPESFENALKAAVEGRGDLLLHVLRFGMDIKGWRQKPAIWEKLGPLLHKAVLANSQRGNVELVRRIVVLCGASPNAWGADVGVPCTYHPRPYHDNLQYKGASHYNDHYTKSHPRGATGYSIGMWAQCKPESALVKAAKRGLTNTVRVLLSCEAQIDLQALWLASKEGHTGVVRALLGAGASPDLIPPHSSPTSTTALIEASMKGCAPIVSVLIDAKADVNKCDDWGFSALMYSCQYGRTECVEGLLGANAAVNTQVSFEWRHENPAGHRGWTALMLACERGDTQIVRLLLDAGAEVNLAAEGGWTALMAGGKGGTLDVVRALIEAGADVNAERSFKETALFDICSQSGPSTRNVNLFELVNQLVKAGARTDLTNHKGDSLLHFACRQGEEEVVELLLKKGASVDLANMEGVTCLMEACQNGHTEVVQVLLKAKADLKAVDRSGCNALMLACKAGHTGIVRALVEDAGADVNIKAGGGWTALMFASQGPNGELVRLLLKAQGQVNAENELGETALMEACKHKQLDVVKRLVSANARVNGANKKGETALFFACQSEDESVVEILYNALVRSKGDAGAEQVLQRVREKTKSSSIWSRWRVVKLDDNFWKKMEESQRVAEEKKKIEREKAARKRAAGSASRRPGGVGGKGGNSLYTEEDLDFYDDEEEEEEEDWDEEDEEDI
uniref:Uncharacterized protein n=1 Tax=Chromera velia CCMP2878 TaxID=1169474 RepID=A0A0G4FVZ8_9ALVE|eukprot:Cvel_19058.t1-p1 / transcript=Cvel_19058.t1 / gene=Cvel_19058 / organism=Chromera_velia_CCMP2878 / gene_product=Putative ankyrin repeat protein RF_0381, putative / transcript_product=Putative ankyrin repeat protein RF_0381, putative / location=Cvel_scaffold1616:27157-29283(+) / protein_length=709 / sequence_SO=supercontig / SO=protein_coding / is_pseudo=false